jgi:hypothetical protein
MGLVAVRGSDSDAAVALCEELVASVDVEMTVAAPATRALEPVAAGVAP